MCQTVAQLRTTIDAGLAAPQLQQAFHYTNLNPSGDAPDPDGNGDEDPQPDPDPDQDPTPRTDPDPQVSARDQLQARIQSSSLSIYETGLYTRDIVAAVFDYAEFHGHRELWLRADSMGEATVRLADQAWQMHRGLLDLTKGTDALLESWKTVGDARAAMDRTLGQYSSSSQLARELRRPLEDLDAALQRLGGYLQ